MTKVLKQKLNPVPCSRLVGSQSKRRAFRGWINNNLRLLTTVMIMLSLVFVLNSSSAQTVNELKTEISDKQRELDKIMTEIDNLQTQINRKKSEIASLKNEVALYDLQIRQTEQKIAAVQLEIDKLSREILETQIEIKRKEEQIEKEKLFLAETLRLINEYDSVTPLEITLGNETFSEFLDQVQYTANLQEKTQEILNIIKELKAQLEEKKAELDRQLAEEQKLRDELDSNKKALVGQRADKQTILTRTRGQERTYQALLTDANQKQEQVEREIFDLEIEIRRQIGDKSLPPIKGILRWPMSGILTQGYGKTGFTALGYSFHNGIDVAAPAGAKIYAAGDGVVYATGRGTAAYGNWIVIKHTITKDGKTFNIFTLYGHLQSFIVSTGKAVLSGDLIGYEGNTGNTTRLLYGPERGYHLHFMVLDEEGFAIKDGAYQDRYGSYKIPYGYTYNPLNFLR